MRKLLMAVSALIFIIMVAETVRASLQMGITAAWDDYAANPWAVATLYDAYSGFTLYWLWVAFRERSWGPRIVWLILIMTLGNIATSAYLFWQLWRLRPDEPVANLLISRPA